MKRTISKSERPYSCLLYTSRPLSYLHRLPLRWTAPPKVSRQLLILYFFTQILFPSFIFYLLFEDVYKRQSPDSV